MLQAVNGLLPAAAGKQVTVGVVYCLVTWSHTRSRIVHCHAIRVADAVPMPPYQCGAVLWGSTF